MSTRSPSAESVVGKRRGLRTIRDVAERQLCTGCGACAYVSPDDYVMVDDLDLGRRPIPLRPSIAPGPLKDAEAMLVCPGVSLQHDLDRTDPGLIEELLPAWGPVLAIWEGHAADPEIRWSGSSGGAATALALYCLERAGVHGVLHSAARGDAPWLNETVLSTGRAELLAATGSRYAPASPCDGLDMIERAPGPCVFIGKPCDVAAVQRARQIRPSLAKRLGPTIAFFCAGTPSTRGTLALLERVGVPDPNNILDIRYRGNGWPGRWTVKYRLPGGDIAERSLSYEESWGFLQAYRQWRCYICPDHTGEFADVAVGDPWYRALLPGEPGRSLVLARTAEGLSLVREAAEAGYLVLDEAAPDLLPRSQPNLLKARGRVWGQLLTLRLMGVATPRYRGLPSFRVWWKELDWAEKLRSIGGTGKRVLRRRLRARVSVVPSPHDATGSRERRIRQP